MYIQVYTRIHGTGKIFSKPLKPSKWQLDHVQIRIDLVWGSWNQVTSSRACCWQVGSWGPRPRITAGVDVLITDYGPLTIAMDNMPKFMVSICPLLRCLKKETYRYPNAIYNINIYIYNNGSSILSFLWKEIKIALWCLSDVQYVQWFLCSPKRQDCRENTRNPIRLTPLQGSTAICSNLWNILVCEQPCWEFWSVTCRANSFPNNKKNGHNSKMQKLILKFAVNILSCCGVWTKKRTKSRYTPRF
jgi:hypothetical protein